MSSDYPFDPNTPLPAEDRTILRPNPGGQRPGGGAQSNYPPPNQPSNYQQPNYQAGYPPPTQQGYQGAPGMASSSAGINVLMDAAAKLLALIGRMRTTAQHNDVNGLHRQVIQEIQSFESQARGRGASPEHVLAARYALCAAVDEAVLNTPWGSNSVWSNQSMLSAFHQETWGGEKVFQIIDRIRQQPASNVDLIEILAVLLAMGFEGKFRVQPNGRMLLEQMRDELFNAIRMQRGEFERELSPNWRGIDTRKNALSRYVPFWVIAAITGALMLTIYIGFSVVLHNSASPLIEELEKVSVPPKEDSKKL